MIFCPTDRSGSARPAPQAGAVHPPGTGTALGVLMSWEATP